MAGYEIHDPVLDPDLNAPPDGVPVCPPVTTRPQILPFGALTWENFERLCYRIASQGQRVEHLARYGRSGQAQQGIDIFARLTSAKYQVWQAKRYSSITAGDIRTIIKTFRAGTWKEKSEQLILAVQASLADTKVQDAIEREAVALKAIGITLIPRGGEELSEILRGYPELVDDFFGRGWVEAFLGPEIAKSLGARLDGAEFARVRAQLRDYYNAHFHLLDVGVALPMEPHTATETPPSLLQRYTIPDVLVRDTIFTDQQPPTPNQSDTASADTTAPSAPGDEKYPGSVLRREYVRRTSLAPWLSAGTQLAVTGDAGSGKSTLLRCIALDILLEQGTFPEISRRWGNLLPIHLSFSRWSRLSAAYGRAAGLKEVVAELLQPALTADLISLLDRAIDEGRILLLLDGLDEWSDEQAARTSLQQTLAFLMAHSIPTVVTARPRGLHKIGAMPSGWRIAELAPLSIEQQRKLAEVWFAKTATRASIDKQNSDARGPIEARLDRFFAELRRDRHLSTLAGNPLLLVGLVALSIRQIALPRNKTQAIESLVAILIETHPEQRATEAGDTQPRFVSIPDANERRAALARLAFVARSATGGGTYDVNEAKRTILKYLVDDATFAYPPDRARRAAAEMLAVNAETVGLLAERAPGEIGFAHAVFEEFLAAEHIQGWSFPEITSFVQSKSGEPLWRNVIANLASLLDRPTEVQDLVAVIEKARAEDAGREATVSRDVLLADIAFGSARKPPATAKRLTDRAFETIERGDWIPARREILRSALTNLGDTGATTPVDDQISRWAPRRVKYLERLFEVMASWAPTPDLLVALTGGLYDEERSNQRAAARTLGCLFGGRSDVQGRLLATLKTTIDLSVAAATLEALTIGWPEAPGLHELHDHAARSQEPTLRLVGIAGRAASGRADLSDRDALVALLSEFPEIGFRDRPTARALLSQHWPDDPKLVASALRAVRDSGSRRGEFERESATYYLLHSSPANPSVTKWVLQELKHKHPFLHSYDSQWDQVAAFALEHGEIRAAVNDVVKSDWGGRSLHYLHNLILALRCDELRDALIDIATGERWSAISAVGLLLEGWDKSDPAVAAVLDEIGSWDDRRLQSLAGFLPQIIADSEVCRARLLSIARKTQTPRLDLVASGFAAQGCTADDKEVIDVLISGLGEGAPLFDPGAQLLAYFPGNARVRQYAIDALNSREPPLATCARSYKDDEEIRNLILNFVNPLPPILRGDVADIAAGDPTGRPCFDTLLEDYDVEVDGELKIAASIYYHRDLVSDGARQRSDHVEKLTRDLQAVGSDMHERRAAAFAGMLILGHVRDVVPMTDYGDKPLHVESGSGYGQESDSLMALIAERWQEISDAFGSDFAGRFGGFGADEGHIWDCLAPHLHASSAARRDFLGFANRTDGTLGLRSFLALAREQPSSDVLLRHCWRVLESDITWQHERHSAWAVQRTRVEIAYILRDQFCDSADVVARLQKVFKRDQRTGIVALSLFSPTDPLLSNIQSEPIEIGQRYSEWVVAMHLAGRQSGPEDFVAVTTAMLNRPSHGIWDFQDVINRAVIERLGSDPDAVEQLRSRLIDHPTTSEIASIPRYLSAAGLLDEETTKRCVFLLQKEARESLPRAGYDAVDQSIRAVSRSLLEVIAPGFSV